MQAVAVGSSIRVKDRTHLLAFVVVAAIISVAYYALVSALEALPMPDQLQIARLKKKKLTLRDQIAKLEDRLTPDIIA